MPSTLFGEIGFTPPGRAERVCAPGFHTRNVALSVYNRRAVSSLFSDSER